MCRMLLTILIVCTQIPMLFAQTVRSSPTPDTRVQYEHFDLVFHNYETSNTMQEEDEPWMTALNKTITKDTIVLQEYNNYLSSGDTITLQIIPQNDDDRFKVYYSLQHSVVQQYDYTKDGELEEWAKGRVSWTGHSPTKQLVYSSGYYIIPSIDYTREEAWIKDRLSLRDTLVDIPSEGGNIATVVYKEHAAVHGISELLLKVKRYNSGRLVETKYVRVFILNGC